MASPGPRGSDAENADPAGGTLRKLFEKGAAIETKRCALQRPVTGEGLALDGSSGGHAGRCPWGLSPPAAHRRPPPAAAHSLHAPPAPPPSRSTDDLFESLEQRTLTEEEQRIIAQRVRSTRGCWAAAVAATAAANRCRQAPALTAAPRRCPPGPPTASGGAAAAHV